LRDERLRANFRLEFVREDMAEEIFAMVDGNREHLRPWFPWVDKTQTVADTLQFVARMGEIWQRGEGGSFQIIADGQMVGTAGIHQMQVQGDAQVGYWLAKEQTGRGYARAATVLLVNYFFEHTPQSVICICCAPDNVPSARVAQALGFSHIERRVGCHSDQLREVDVYALTRSEWQKSAIFGARV